MLESTKLDPIEETPAWIGNATPLRKAWTLLAGSRRVVVGVGHDDSMNVFENVDGEVFIGSGRTLADALRDCPSRPRLWRP